MPQIWLLRHRNNEFIIFGPDFGQIAMLWILRGNFWLGPFCESQPSPIQRSSYFKLLSIAPPAPVKYSFSNRYLTYPFSMFLLKKKTDVFHLKIFFSCPCSKRYPAKFSFFLSSNPFLVFTVFDSLFLFLSLLCLCRRMKSGYNEGLWCLRVSDRVI